MTNLYFFQTPLRSKERQFSLHKNSSMFDLSFFSKAIITIVPKEAVRYCHLWTISETVVKRRSPRRHALYIRSVLINHLFVGKDIAVRQEKEIHESSRFLRAMRPHHDVEMWSGLSSWCTRCKHSLHPPCAGNRSTQGEKIYGTAQRFNVKGSLLICKLHKFSDERSSRQIFYGSAL